MKEKETKERKTPMPAYRIIRKPEVIATVGLSDPTIWRMEQKGEFPKRLQVGANSVGWLSTEIYGWMAERAAEREAPR
jgi:prophage regulatory protein